MDKDYKQGWDDSFQFRSEWQRIQRSGSGAGISVLMLGIIWVCSLTAVIFMPGGIVNYAPLIWAYSIGIFLMVAGYFLDKRDRRLYDLKVKEFRAKWADKLSEGN